MNSAYSPPPEVGRFQQRALIVGAGFWLLFLIGAFLDRDQFFHSYLIGFLFWTGISLGCLALLMLQHLTGGGWGFVIRRVLEAATRTLPLMLVLFVPIVLGAHRIYPWMNHEEMQKSAVLMEKARIYLNLQFFILRAAIYFAVWLTLAYFLNRWSREQDRNAKRELSRKMGMISGPGFAFLILTITFASVDWVMSIDPEWFSTIYGLLFVAAWSLSALAFVIAAMVVLTNHEPMKHVVAPLHIHDLGKLLLALVMLWAYFGFSQFLIIWSGNLPEEISWFLPRTRGGWGVIALAVVVLHFALPFLFLLSRSAKRDPRKLVLVAGLILVMRIIDLIWMVEPNPHFMGEHFLISKIWMDIVAPLAFGGIWLATFAWQLTKRSLIPFNDPQLKSVLEQAHAGH
jgi:hypothetical protein